MPKQLNLIPLEAIIGRVLSIVPKDSISESRLEEWAYEAYESIAPREIYEVKNEFVTTYNHSAPIPAGAFNILMILYNTGYSASSRTPSSGNTTTSTSVSTNVSQQGGTVTTTTTNSTVTTTAVNQSSLNAHGVAITSSAPEHTIKENVLGFINPSFASSWKPLAFSENLFHSSILIPNSPNVHTACEHTFSINPRTKCIITSFDIGELAIAYTGIPQDEDGNWLIPDIEVVKVALETYCLKKYWQLRMNHKEEGAGQLYQMYGGQYELLAPKATGELMMPDLFDLQNLRNMNKFMNETSPFSMGLGALNNREVINFNRPQRR